jgi:hypothetical protein
MRGAARLVQAQATIALPLAMIAAILLLLAETDRSEVYLWHSYRLDSLLDPVNGCITPEVARRIVDWHPDEELRRCIEELGRKADEGTLTTEEDVKYSEYIGEGDLIALLQAKVRRMLKQSAV